MEEKIADAATVHRLTGLAPAVALHIPWDKVDDYEALARHAEEHGVRLGTINSNTFQDDDYKLGALTHVDRKIRQKAIDHHFECIDVMNATGSRDLKIWLAEGSNYPGQADLRGRQDRLAESLAIIHERLTDEQRLVLEYKLFEPAFYHTDVPDWGTAYTQVAALGDNAVVCLDTGHHAPSTNIEFIVRAAAAAREAGLVRLQQPLLRRRRPDRRRRGPVPAVPDHLRGDPRRRLRARQRRRVHARPVPQHRGQDPGADPVGPQRAGDDGPGAARRPRRPRPGAGGR
ncbi:TIM barrel protein [Nocardioides sp. TF02-7]|uniref:TIM barrel protein n=1 Tax=Nocardioides sp. TF02-7 TaxID=2917724 RepID=UPI001F0545AC|nr:TIM barrel protein [Nocardioides sp. TF02-7]UMG94489.1 L-rhamnose isomerase [Nocardioides sp. TF02-7]